MKDLWCITVIAFLFMERVCVRSVTSVKRHMFNREKMKVELKNKLLVLIFDRLGGTRKGEGGVDVRLIGS